MGHSRISILALGLTAGVAVAVWATAIPLGVPGEWAWSRLAPTSSQWLSLTALAIVGSCYVGFAWLGARRIEQCRGWERSGWLAGLALAGFAWLWMAQETAPDGYQL